jgi:hypothetical protein
LELAARLRDHLDLSGAVETGTYLGDSAALLARHFAQVWTVELAEPLWQQARRRHGASTNITFLQGASEDVLPDVADSAPGPLLYWLDGHWSGAGTAGEGSECPVLDEIKAIDAAAHGARSVVLIDDARLFQTPPPPPHDQSQWPTLMEVTDALRATHDRYVTLLEDVIVAVPAGARHVVEDYGMNRQWAPEHRPSQGVLGKARSWLKRS